MARRNPKIDSISITSDPGFLVWSKPEAYGLYEYDRFTKEAVVHIGGMLRDGGCQHPLHLWTENETCAQGVFCVRVLVGRGP